MQSKTSSNSLATCTALAMAALLIIACDRKPADTRAAHRVLYIANYEGYIGKNTIADFERLTGVRVKYGTYDTANTLESWVWAGDLRYDVISTSTDFFSREIKAGAFRPLDRSKLQNWRNLDPMALSVMARADPNNRYAVPYLHSINGFAYNVDMVRARMPDAPVDSLDMLFKPEVIRRFADCGVTFLDSPSDVLPLALNYLHIDPNTASAQAYKAAESLLMVVRPYIRSFDSLEYLSDLANGETCVAMGYSSDAAATRALLRATGSRVRLAFTVPKEGSCISYDAFLTTGLRSGSRRRVSIYKFRAGAESNCCDYQRDLLRQQQSRGGPVRRGANSSRSFDLPNAGDPATPVPASGSGPGDRAHSNTGVRLP